MPRPTCCLAARLARLAFLAALLPGPVAVLPLPAAEPSGTLAERFRDPPRDRRILQIIHGFPDGPEAREALVRRLEARGFGGVVANVSFQEYLRSEEKWRSFEAGAAAVRAAGRIVWLYDEDGYPSAAAGGLTLEGHPEWEARGLLCVVEDSSGTGPLEVKLPEGDVVLAAAYPLRDGRGDLSGAVDLKPQLSPDRTLRWDRPGSWRLCAFVESRLYERTHATGNLYKKRPYPNLLEREAVQRFIEVTHEAYARRFAPLAGRFEAIFTDEPSLMSVFLEPAPHPALPWSRGLAEAFRRSTGRDLAPLLPALAADFGSEGLRARCELWSVVGRELASSYFGQIQEWCRAHGIASTGHLLAEEDVGSHIGFYGDFYACAERLDYPGIDCLTSDPATVPWHVAKLLGSIACVRGAPRAMSETSDHSQRYRPPGDARPPRDVSAGEVLGTAHLLYAAGINTTTSYYSWSGFDDGAVRRTNEHVGRLGVVLAGARHACDVALLYPLESAWARFTPQRHWARAPGVMAIDGLYRDACYTLFRWRRDFDVIASSALAAARTDGGALAIGSERYRALVLPACDVLPAEALRRAAELVRSGGVLLAIGEAPANTPRDFPSPEARAASEDLFGAAALSPRRDEERLAFRRHPSGGAAVFLPARSAWLLPAVLDGLLEPDLQAPAGSPLRYSFWRVDGRHAYFLLNDSALPAAAEVSTRGEGPAELWDPSTGRIAPAERGPAGRWPLSLAPYGAAFLLFPEVREPKMLPGRLEEAPLVEASPLEGAPGGPPRLAVEAPPHVEANVEPVAGAGSQVGPGMPARVAARIAKGGVDCWCFADLRFSAPADLSAFRALEVATRVPAAQAGCAARLTIILREEREGGASADYIADARRSLGEPGPAASAVPFDAFRLAGWSRDPDGRLDLERVRSVRAGWGGYTGREGESLAFDLEAVRILRVR
ncbi:MAG: hypothetical protein HY721_35580 [Planctomycetes bacterium]|nr:hypothetical protein [Planctomycetota bacterium]